MSPDSLFSPVSQMRIKRRYSFAVAGPMLLARQQHRRVFDQCRKILAGYIGIYAEAHGLQLVTEPELDTLAVELGVSVRSVPQPQETLWYRVVYL